MSRRARPQAPAEPEHPELEDVVPHPRYGSSPIPSGYNFTEEDVLGSFYGYRIALRLGTAEKIYPESAIPADLKRQNFSTFARCLYVDILKTCLTCGRPFLFFAREQQFWYEDLGVYVDAPCSYCVACRRERQELKQRFHRYSELVARRDLDREELAELVRETMFVWNAGILHNEQRLRWIRNRARKLIPEDRATERIDKLVAELDEARRARSAPERPWKSLCGH